MRLYGGAYIGINRLSIGERCEIANPIGGGDAVNCGEAEVQESENWSNYFGGFLAIQTTFSTMGSRLVGLGRIWYLTVRTKAGDLFIFPPECF